ncbi:MAG: hypothetical protein ACOVRN_03490 [Flavobacterium sp.]
MDVHNLLSQIDAVLSSYDIYFPEGFHAIIPVLVVDADILAGATHVYQALPSMFGEIKLKVPDIVEFIGLLDILYPPVVVLTVVVPIGIPSP